MALGEKLQDARTRKGWTTGQVADATRMMVQIVEELEREDFRRIAAPIYGRGFIKLYAEHVGIDPEPLIQEFMEIYTGARPPVVARRPVAGPPESPAPAAGTPPAPTPGIEAPPADTAARSLPLPEPAAAVVPAELPVAPTEALDDLFAAARRPAPPPEKTTAPEAPRMKPPRVNPVAVRATHRPTPAQPPSHARMPEQPPHPPVRRPPGATALVTAGLKRLWGDLAWPSAWFSRKRILLLAGLGAVAVVLLGGIRALLKVTADAAGRNETSLSRQVLPPPDPYVD
jgi:transcriptional regulator with XRE-family HTH domain